MAIMKVSQIRKLSTKDVDKRLSELNLELAKEKGNIHLGSNVTSPGRIKELRRTIARLKTIKGQR